MAQQQLAELIIEFTMKGVEALKAGLASINQAMTKLTVVAEVLGRAMLKSFTLATAAMVGFAVAGFRASYLSDLMGISLDRLARTVGALVAPEVLKLIALIDRFTNWIQRLEPAQRQMLATWIEMGAVGLALSRIFGGWVGILGALVVGSGQGSEVMGKFSEVGKKLFETLERLQPVIEAIAEVVVNVLNVALDVLNVLIDTGIIKWLAAAAAAWAFAKMASVVVTAITTIVSALRVLTLAKITALAFSGPSGWAQIAGGIAIAGAAIAGAGLMFNAFSKSADTAKGKVKDLAKELPKRSPGFESLEQTFMRIAAASVNVGIKADAATGKVGKTPEEQAVDWLEKIAGSTGPLADLLKEKKGAFAE